jgi:hypothetical protein
VMSHSDAQAVEGRMKGLVHPGQPAAHVELQKKCQSALQSQWQSLSLWSLEQSKNKGRLGKGRQV